MTFESDDDTYMQSSTSLKRKYVDVRDVQAYGLLNSDVRFPSPELQEIARAPYRAPRGSRQNVSCDRKGRNTQ